MLIENYDWKSPLDDPFWEDQNRYKGGPKQSSNGEVVTILENLLLTPDHGTV